MYGYNVTFSLEFADMNSAMVTHVHQTAYSVPPGLIPCEEYAGVSSYTGQRFLPGRENRDQNGSIV